jgi:hypothetical protein
MRLTSNKRGLANRVAREFVRGVNNGQRDRVSIGQQKSGSGSLWFVAGVAVFLMLCSVFGGLLFH